MNIWAVVVVSALVLPTALVVGAIWKRSYRAPIGWLLLFAGSIVAAAAVAAWHHQVSAAAGIRGVGFMLTIMCGVGFCYGCVVGVAGAVLAFGGRRLRRRSSRRRDLAGGYPNPERSREQLLADLGIADET